MYPCSRRSVYLVSTPASIKYDVICRVADSCRQQLQIQKAAAGNDQAAALKRHAEATDKLKLQHQQALAQQQTEAANAQSAAVAALALSHRKERSGLADEMRRQQESSKGELSECSAQLHTANKQVQKLTDLQGQQSVLLAAHAAAIQGAQELQLAHANELTQMQDVHRQALPSPGMVLHQPAAAEKVPTSEGSAVSALQQHRP